MLRILLAVRLNFSFLFFEGKLLGTWAEFNLKNRTLECKMAK